MRIDADLKNVGLPWSSLPTQNRPYPPKKCIALLRIFFSFYFFNKPFKIIKSCILIKETYRDRYYIVYEFLPYHAYIQHL